MIRSTGFFRNKAKSIQNCCRDLVERHGGEVPRTLEELTALPGVGRKTANVVLGNAFGIPGLVVDTHVGRLSKRLGLTRENDPVKIELALMAIVPRERWTRVLPLAHPPRPPRLRRAQAALLDLPARAALPARRRHLRRLIGPTHP